MVHSTGNGGWQQSSAIGTGNLSQVALDQNNPTVLYAIGSLFWESTQGVYKFTVAYSGSSVASITRVTGTFNTGLGSAVPHRIVYNAATSTLYLTTDHGVFQSTNQAASWTPVGSGLSYSYTTALAVTPDGGHVIVGTNGGIWKYDLTTTTTLTSSDDSSLAGKNVTLTATVSPSTATGTVTFYDGASSIGTGTLSPGTATLTLSTLTIGTHSLTAVYGGDANDFGSTSAILEQAVSSTGLTCIAFVVNQPPLRRKVLLSRRRHSSVVLWWPHWRRNSTADAIPLRSRHHYNQSPALLGYREPNSVPTEAALLVNDCVTNSGTSSTGASCAPNGSFAGGTPTQGFLQNGALVFSGFTLPATSGAFQLRITNVRVNANAVVSGTFVTGTILATFPVQNQSGLVLGVVQSSLSVALSPVTFYQTQLQTTTINLTLSELVQTAFKSPASATANGTPGQWYQNAFNDESQTVIQTPGSWTDPLGAVAGQGDSATRIRVNVSNLATGVTVTMPVSVTNGSSSLVATTSGDIGSFHAASGNGIPVTGAGSVTYRSSTKSEQHRSLNCR